MGRNIINYITKRYKSYRILGIGIIFVSFGIIAIMALDGINLYGNSAIMALYYTGHISYHSAELSLAALGFGDGPLVAYLLSTAGYTAYIDGATLIFVRYAVIDLLGIWGWIILGAVAGTAA